MELQRQIQEMAASQGNSTGTSDTSVKPVPRPKGSSGTDFSIQEVMGLAGSVKKYETYKAIQVSDINISAYQY